MKSPLAVVCLFFLTVARHDVQGSGDMHKNILPDGEYIGREPMPNLTPEDHRAAWFHENSLLIRNDEAVLDKVPIVVRGRKKGHSTSDGGFMTYRAKFSMSDRKSFVALRLCQSDYLVFPADKHDQYTEIKSYPVKVAPRRIEINGVLYRPTKLKKIKLDRLLRLLNTEPLEKANNEQ